MHTVVVPPGTGKHWTRQPIIADGEHHCLAFLLPSAAIYRPRRHNLWTTLPNISATDHMHLMSLLKTDMYFSKTHSLIHMNHITVLCICRMSITVCRRVNNLTFVWCRLQWRGGAAPGGGAFWACPSAAGGVRGGAMEGGVEEATDTQLWTKPTNPTTATGQTKLSGAQQQVRETMWAAPCEESSFCSLWSVSYW